MASALWTGCGQSEIKQNFYLVNNTITITLKSAIPDSCNLLIEPQTVSNTYTQVAWGQPCANPKQHILRLSCATCCVPHATKEQLSY